MKNVITAVAVSLATLAFANAASAKVKICNVVNCTVVIQKTVKVAKEAPTVLRDSVVGIGASEALGLAKSKARCAGQLVYRSTHREAAKSLPPTEC